MTVKSRNEQRQRTARSLMLSLQAEAHAINLLEAILAGDVTLLTEFQQHIQYLPAATRLRLLDRLENR